MLRTVWKIHIFCFCFCRKGLKIYLTGVVLLFFCLLQSSALFTCRGEVVGATTIIQTPCLLTALMSWGEGAAEGLLRTFLFSPFLIRKAVTSCLWAWLWVVEPVFGNGDHGGWGGGTESLLLATLWSRWSVEHVERVLTVGWTFQAPSCESRFNPEHHSVEPCGWPLNVLPALPSSRCCLSGTEKMFETYRQLGIIKWNGKFNNKLHLHTYTHTHKNTHPLTDSSQSSRPHDSPFIILSCRPVGGHLLWITALTTRSPQFWGINGRFCPACLLPWSAKIDQSTSEVCT